MERICTMKELPLSERPYEKCMEYGPAALTDAELIAVMLRTGSHGKSALDMARELLIQLGGERPLASITGCSVEELCQIPGIGMVKAVLLQCAGELACRIAREEARDRVSLTQPESIASYFMEDMRQLRQEEIRAAFFDTKSHLIRTVLLSRGTVNASLITPREVFLTALRHRAVFVVIIHNHPSGDPTPSTDDLLITRRLQESGEMLGIPLLDHIIIGDHCYVSLKSRGFL